MRLLPVFVLLSLLCACGQVGDLYLPAEPVESAPAPAPATPEAPAPQKPTHKAKKK